jgi:hypothetical protein
MDLQKEESLPNETRIMTQPNADSRPVNGGEIPSICPAQRTNILRHAFLVQPSKGPRLFTLHYLTDLSLQSFTQDAFDLDRRFMRQTLYQDPVRPRQDRRIAR